MKGTVAIIGANQTGLFAAKLFSEQGFSVFVFEKTAVKTRRTNGRTIFLRPFSKRSDYPFPQTIFLPAQGV